MVHLRFGPPLRHNTLGELVSLKLTGTVQEYQDQILALLSRASSLSEEQQVEVQTERIVPDRQSARINSDLIQSVKPDIRDFSQILDLEPDSFCRI